MAAHATGLEKIELKSLRERLIQLFALLEEASASALTAVPGEWLPPVDICESEEAVMVYLELPGLDAEQINVQLTGTQLRVSGEKAMRAARRRKISHLCSERSYGRFERTLELQRWSISVRQATAELRDGVLAVRLPKIADRRGTIFKIPVTEAVGGND